MKSCCPTVYGIDHVITCRLLFATMWAIGFHDEFAVEVQALPPQVRNSLLAHANVLAAHGPTLGRPLVDHLEGSSHANMKELRFNAVGGVWRVAFAFDLERTAILLVAGDKRGVSQERFYRSLIECADRRFSAHLKSLEIRKRNEKHGQEP